MGLRAGHVSASNIRMLAFILVLALVCIGVIRIIHTYDVFNQTWDEPAHIAAGMEWLDQGRYTYESQHPPLARIAAAIGPYLDGLSSAGQKNKWTEGNAILHARGTYERNLALARLGTLPFFVLASLVVWLWARKAYGLPHALAAVALFTTLPPILAHAGVAATDMALAATLSGALLAFVFWLERATFWRSTLLGMATALALVSKFSAILFVPAIMLGLWLLDWFAQRDRSRRAGFNMAQAAHLLYSALVCLFVIWAAYRFSSAVLAEPGYAHPSIDRIVGSAGWLHDAAYRIAESVRVPAPEFFRGIQQVFEHNQDGHLSYFLGEVRSDGWWYYFPVILAFKTPLPFLVFGLAGVVALLRSIPVRPPGSLYPLVAALVLLLAVLPSNINIGVRHILPIYPLLTIVAGMGAVHLWHSSRPGSLGKITVALLCLWQVAASVRAHPDYLAYFNELAGSNPEHIAIAGDLDWGQDLGRLSVAVREKNIGELWLRYYGSADVARHVPARLKQLEPGAPVTGWVAISMFSLKAGGGIPPYRGFAWLDKYEPVVRVGKSILLYHIPDDSS